MRARARIAVTLGDPGGIGPEIVVRALEHAAERFPDIAFDVLGSSHAMLAAADALGVEPYWWRLDAGSSQPPPEHAGVTLIDSDPALRSSSTLGDGGSPRFEKRPHAVGGALSFRWVEDAIEAARLPADDPARVNGIVTAPISKEAWNLAGHRRFPGHTELLASRFGAKRSLMMFEGPRLRVSLATVHVPLFDVRDQLTIGRVHDAIDLGAEGCRLLGVATPRIAVCGLNPHAGESGLLGDEETRLIEPAIQLAVEHGLDVRGPFPGDTVFLRAIEGEFDLVVAMYHDQGLIPVKLLDRDASVNMTVGLPVIRTSPDHGTAFDIAGMGRANAGSMIAAIDTAVRVATRL
ncbi:MAG: 4-hydroxythreonine-4-phosphate dehydrogenase PdxA [Planctomycetota bacterium]